jgi:hypothetical protein
VDFDARDFGFANRDRQSDALKQREVDVNVQGLRLEASKAIGNRDQLLAQAPQVLEPFVEAQIFHPVDAHLDAQEGAELFVHAAHEILAVDAQHVMAVVQFLDGGAQLIGSRL